EAEDGIRDWSVTGVQTCALPISAFCAEDYEFVDHPTGATYGRSGLLDVFRRQFRIQDLTRRRETLASLGDSLALSRTWWSGSGADRKSVVKGKGGGRGGGGGIER